MSCVALPIEQGRFQLEAGRFDEFPWGQMLTQLQMPMGSRDSIAVCSVLAKTGVLMRGFIVLFLGLVSDYHGLGDSLEAYLATLQNLIHL